MASASAASPNNAATQLDYLQLLFDHLPNTIPIGTDYYGVTSFLDPDDIDLTGSPAGALNMALERAFGRRDQGPVKLLRRGDTLTSVANALRTHITGDKEDILLLKWTQDLIIAAKAAYEAAGAKIPEAGRRVPKLSKKMEEIQQDARKRKAPTSGSSTGLDIGSDDEATAAVSSAEGVDEQSAPKRKKLSKAQRVAAGKATAQRYNWDPSDLVDDPEPEYKTGRRADSLATALTIRCHSKKSSDTERFRCSQEGCLESWKSRQPARIYNHAISECQFISESLRSLALGASAKSSLGAQVADLNEAEPDTKDNTEVATHLKQPANKGKNTTPSVFTSVTKEGRNAQQLRFDHAILRLFCAAFIPPYVLDYPEWKAALQIANPSLRTISSTTLSAIQIPKESAHALKSSISKLKGMRNLTISFDGGTTRSPQSIYTVHVTTPDKREAHLIAGDESSGVSHTGEHLKALLIRVIDLIGRWCFAAIASDSTGNTKLARELLVRIIPWIIILADPCHQMNNTSKDICLLQHFTDCILKSRKVIKFFSKSTFGSSHLSALRVRTDIRRGLISIGKTRFATMYYAVDSILRCLPAIKRLTKEGVVDIEKKDAPLSFMRNVSSLAVFELHLQQLLAVLSPLAKSIKCLESSHSTPADVYLFWLATMATYAQLFDRNDLGLPSEVITEIRRIVNTRYKEMIDGPGKDVYIATFFLDPRYINSAIWSNKDANPLSTSVTIRRKQKASSADTEKPDEDLRKSMPAYPRVGAYLVKVLHTEIAASNSTDSKDIRAEVFGSFEDAAAILEAFRKQFMSYTRQEYPFQRKTIESPRSYWKELRKHPDASVLAVIGVKLYSIVPNSMAEERTVSNFTKLNSPDRSRQKASTIVHMTRIRQHYRRESDQANTGPRPTVKFRDMTPFLRPADSTPPAGFETSETLGGSVRKGEEIAPELEKLLEAVAGTPNPEATPGSVAQPESGLENSTPPGQPESCSDDTDEDEAAWRELEDHVPPSVPVDGLEMRKLFLVPCLSPRSRME